MKHPDSCQFAFGFSWPLKKLAVSYRNFTAHCSCVIRQTVASLNNPSLEIRAAQPTAKLRTFLPLEGSVNSRRINSCLLWTIYSVSRTVCTVSCRISITFVLILPSAARVDLRAFSPITFPTEYLYAFPIVYVHAMWPLRVTVVGLMPHIIFGKFCTWWSSSLLSFLHSSYTTSLFHVTSTCNTRNCHPCTKQQEAAFFSTSVFILLCKKGEERRIQNGNIIAVRLWGSKCNIHINVSSSNKISAVLWASVMHKKQHFSLLQFLSFYVRKVKKGGFRTEI